MEIDLCPAFEPVFIGFSVVLHAALGQIDFPFLRNFTLRYYMKGRSKNSKGAHPKSRKFKGEKRRNESIKARSTPFRSPPIIPQCFSKNHSKTRESKIFSYRFLLSLSKMANKKDPKHPEVLGSYNYLPVVVLFEFLLCPTSAVQFSPLRIDDRAPIEVAVLQAVDEDLGGGDVCGNGNVVHVTDAQQVHLVRLAGLGADGVAEEE